MTEAIGLQALTKSFGETQVLRPLDLSIGEGTFTALLGPSGCGKTTILNLIGGLDQPTSGSISIGGHTVFDRARGIELPAEQRNIGYVFQTYALWPHMTVGENVAYPLKIRGVSRAERDLSARAILDRLELKGLAERYPYQISGGQQQRVAIARALVYKARLLLLDEPLSNLDTQLRERARAWLAEVHAEFKLTTILVTHDQTEALSLCERVILLDRGAIAQDGSAFEVYEKPSSAYAADFVGGANLLPVTVTQTHVADRQTIARVMLGAEGPLNVAAAASVKAGAPAVLVARPQRIALAAEGTQRSESTAVLPFQIKALLYQGAEFEVVGETPFGRLRVLTPSKPPPGPLQAVIPLQGCRCVPAS